MRFKYIGFRALCLALISLFSAGSEISARISPEKADAPSKAQLLAAETNARELGKQWNADSIKRAIAIQADLAQKRQERGDFEKAGDSLREMADFQITLGENEAAVALLNQARRLDARHQNHFKKVKTYSLLALAELRLGNIAEAKKFAEKAVALSPSADHPEAFATALYAQAYVNYEGSEFNLATQNYETSLAWWKKAANTEGEAKTLLELAYAYMTEDELPTGLAMAEESLRLSEQIGNSQIRVLAQNAVGVLKSKLGQKQAALDIFLGSEKQFPDQVNTLEKGDMFNHLAGIYYDFDELKLAQNYRLKALEIYQAEKNPVAQLATLSKLGIITFKLGDESAGLKYFETGFRLARKLESVYWSSVLAQDLGNLYFESDKNKALEYFKIAEPQFEKLKIRSHIATVQSKIGSIYLSQGKNEPARKYFESALNLNRQTRNQLAESQNLYNLALLSSLEHRSEEALELVRQSIEVTESMNSSVINAKLKTTYFSSVYDRYELYISLLMKSHRNSPDETRAALALQTAERSRARSMLENLTLADADPTQDADAETVAREKEIRRLLNSKADKLTDLLSKNAERVETEKLSGGIDALVHELEEIKARLKQESPLYSAIRNPAPFNVGEFQNIVLDDNSLFLEFFFGRQESYLWVIGKNALNAYVLPPREQIEKRIENLSSLLASRQIKEGEVLEAYQQRIEAAEKEYRLEARQLSRELFGQAAARIAGQKLIIVPDGKLHYFPVAALPRPDSESDEPLLLTNETIYEPSAQTLSVLAKRPENPVQPKNLLVFSDPVFAEDDSRLTDSQPASGARRETAAIAEFRFAESLNSLRRLPASGGEAEAIAEIVGASSTDVFSGFAATRGRLVELETQNYKLIHFATHGLMDEQHPQLSGIVLSRFNEKGEKLDEFFRLHDIYSLKLNADLVVLSACETGVGKEVKGEGLMSLNNAFLQVGARSVLASLWKVEDGATLELMKHFYAAIKNENLTPSEALRQAQLKLRENPQYRSPFFWAAFTVQGDPDNAPRLSGDSNVWIYPFFLLLPFALYIFYRRRRQKSFDGQTVSDE